MTSVQDQTNAYRKYAMLSFIKKDRYANEYVSSGKEIDERLLQEFFESSMRVRSRVALITFIKSLTKQSLVTLKKCLLPNFQFLEYINPENITPEISDEEYVLLLQDVKQAKTMPKNVYLAIGQNMALEMLNFNLSRLTELFTATGRADIKLTDAPVDLVAASRNDEYTFLKNIEKFSDTSIVGDEEFDRSAQSGEQQNDDESPSVDSKPADDVRREEDSPPPDSKPIDHRPPSLADSAASSDEELEPFETFDDSLSHVEPFAPSSHVDPEPFTNLMGGGSSPPPAPSFDVEESIAPLDIFNNLKRKRDDDDDDDSLEAKKQKMTLDDLLKSIKLKSKPAFVEQKVPVIPFE